MKPILYTFRRCPYAIRARLALTYAGIAVEYRDIELKNKPQAMLNVSPKGTVPVLEWGDGDIIDESLDVMLWALHQHDPSHWLAYNTQALKLIDENDTTFKGWLDKYKYADRFPEQSPVYYRQHGQVFLQKLENSLEEHTFLYDNHPTLADIALFPFVRQFAFVDKAWFDQAPYPKLQTWLKYHLESSIFKKIMLKRPIWQATNERVVDRPR